MNMPADKDNQTIPLLLAGEGDFLVIVELQGGSNFKEKCISQGIIPGQTMEIINKPANASCLAKIRGARIMIGYGMLERIIVKKV